MDMIKENFNKLNQQAQKDGVQLEMMVTGGESLVLSYQNKKIEKYESNVTKVAGLRVLDGSSAGYASTENLSYEALERSYQDALANARMMKSQGDTIPLASAANLTDKMEDLFVPEEVSIENKKKIAEGLESLLIQADSRIQKVPYSGFREGRGWKRILNSKGLDYEYRSSGYSGYAYGLAKEGEASKMDGSSFFARRFDEIQLEQVIKDAALRATNRLGAKKPPTGKYPVVMDREIAATFIGMLEDYFSAKAVKENRSLLKGKIGQTVASPLMTLVDDPFDRRGLSCRPFDDEGSPSKKTELIVEGRLQNFLTNLELAQALKLPHTASASRSPGSEMDAGSTNLFVKLGTSSRQEMLQGPRVLHLTEISGGIHSGFNEASGDFSLPMEGFLYENGVNTGPVDQFVVSGNILQLLQDVIKVGNEYDKTPSSVYCPDLLIKELSVAGA